MRNYRQKFLMNCQFKNFIKSIWLGSKFFKNVIRGFLHPKLFRWEKMRCKLFNKQTVLKQIICISRISGLMPCPQSILKCFALEPIAFKEKQLKVHILRLNFSSDNPAFSCRVYKNRKLKWNHEFFNIQVRIKY